MRKLLLAVTLVLAGHAAATAATHRQHRRLHRFVHAAPVGYAPAPVEDGGILGLGALPLTVAPLAVGALPGNGAGQPIRPEAARFMGYPYNVPGYRYQGYDACLLRVGGPFGPGPSAGPCPFGFDRAF